MLNKSLIIVMGVSGSGKTSVGQLLAEDISVPFLDADDYHPLSSIEKMSQGQPLNDDDREPWLYRLNKLLKEHLESGCVLACSALKRDYRTRLSDSVESVIFWVYLKGSYEQIWSRMSLREGHYMKAEMLKSQFETLEEPGNAITLDIHLSPERIVEKIKLELE